MRIKGGVRQGGNLAQIIYDGPRRFLFKTLNWENKGIEISDRFRNHPRYADDCIELGGTTINGK